MYSVNGYRIRTCFKKSRKQKSRCLAGLFYDEKLVLSASFICVCAWATFQ